MPHFKKHKANARMHNSQDILKTVKHKERHDNGKHNENAIMETQGYSHWQDKDILMKATIFSRPKENAQGHSEDKYICNTYESTRKAQGYSKDARMESTMILR
jgi:hypothetical protein